MAAWSLRGQIDAITESVDIVCEEGSVVNGNLSANNITLRGCSFTGAYSLTCTTLSCDYESFRALIAAGVNIAGVTTFVSLFAGQVMTWGAAVATTGQFLAPGAQENGTTQATEGNVQIMMPRSYAIRNLYARAPATSCTVTVRKGGVNTSLSCSPASSTASDLAIGHWVTGSATDLISVAVTGAGGGLVRASFEVVLL